MRESSLAPLRRESLPASAGHFSRRSVHAPLRRVHAADSFVHGAVTFVHANGRLSHAAQCDLPTRQRALTATVDFAARGMHTVVYGGSGHITRQVLSWALVVSPILAWSAVLVLAPRPFIIFARGFDSGPRLVTSGPQRPLPSSEVSPDEIESAALWMRGAFLIHRTSRQSAARLVRPQLDRRRTLYRRLLFCLRKAVGTAQVVCVGNASCGASVLLPRW